MYEAVSGELGEAYVVPSDFEHIDIGAVRLKQCDGKDLGDRVPLLEIIVDQQYTITETCFSCIGYPETFVMIQHEAKFSIMMDSGRQVVKTAELHEGMSGGPWLLNGTHKVNGNTSIGNFHDTYSPYYTTDVMVELIKLLSSK